MAVHSQSAGHIVDRADCVGICVGFPKLAHLSHLAAGILGLGGLVLSHSVLGQIVQKIIIKIISFTFWQHCLLTYPHNQ